MQDLLKNDACKTVLGVSIKACVDQPPCSSMCLPVGLGETTTHRMSCSAISKWASIFLNVA
jgi:hypothetical protein